MALGWLCSLSLGPRPVSRKLLHPIQLRVFGTPYSAIPQSLDNW
jgi:hypothetical protein